MKFDKIKKTLKSKHRLVLRRESTLDVEKSIRFSGLHVVLMCILLCALIAGGVIFGLKYYNMNKYFGGIEEHSLREQLISYHHKVKELEDGIISRDNKMESVMLVLSGEIDSTARTTDVLSKVKSIYGENDTSMIISSDISVNPSMGVYSQGQTPSDTLPANPQTAHDLPVYDDTKINKNLKSYLIPPMYGYISAIYDPSKEHYAVDIVSENENTDVVSVADGTVILSDYTLQTGYVLLIRHDKGLISVYKHNKGALKKVGDKVKQGELIAELGNSGKLTTGPHLHFELWLGGEPINPAHYLNFERNF